MKKRIVTGLIFMLMVLALPIHHVHDDHCGYDPNTDSGCMYEIVLFEQKGYGD